MAIKSDLADKTPEKVEKQAVLSANSKSSMISTKLYTFSEIRSKLLNKKIFSVSQTNGFLSGIEEKDFDFKDLYECRWPLNDEVVRQLEKLNEIKGHGLGQKSRQGVTPTPPKGGGGGVGRSLACGAGADQF